LYFVSSPAKLAEMLKATAAHTPPRRMGWLVGQGNHVTPQSWGSGPCIIGARKTHSRAVSSPGPSPVGHAGLGQSWWALTDPASPE